MDPPSVHLADEHMMPSHRRLLGARLYVHCGVRAAVAFTIVVAALFAHYVVGIQLQVGALILLALFIALYNIAPWLVARHFRRTDVPVLEYPRVVAVSHGAIVLDYLALTAAIWLVGGCRSPFVAFYLLHVIVSAVLLSRRSALALTALAYLLLALLVIGEWSGLALPYLPEGAAAGSGLLEARFALTLLVVYLMLFGLTCFLLLELISWLRSGERRVHIANAELQRISDQRRDFLHVAMHNLKAPLGAVTMFLENMLGGLTGPTSEKQREWLGRSLGRLDSLNEFLTDMQALSALEHEIAARSFGSVDMASIVTELVEEYRDIAHEHGLELDLELERSVPPVIGHDRLLREAIVNYITNAIKYTPRGGHVWVTLRYCTPSVRIDVSDDGIGIADEDKLRLFAEFVRVIKPGSKAAGVKGTGLGLSIVKRIVVAHDGEVGVTDRPGGGSTFFIELPPLLE